MAPIGPAKAGVHMARKKIRIAVGIMLLIELVIREVLEKTSY